MYKYPPHTPCQSQVEGYTEGITKLFKTYNGAWEGCRQHTDLGGCLELFEVMAKMEEKLKEVNYQCLGDLVSHDKTQMWLKKSLEIFVRVAWGSTPPKSYLYRNGWLEPSHVAQYCRIRSAYIKVLGDPAFQAFINQMLTQLPGSEGLGRDETWRRSLLPETCNATR